MEISTLNNTNLNFSNSIKELNINVDGYKYTNNSIHITIQLNQYLLHIVCL